MIVEGARGFDVHLLGGDKETSPVAVLEAGLGALTGSVRVRPPEQLAADGAAGMATCQLVQTAEPEKRDLLYVSLPAFEVRSEHNLIEQAEIFGLASATDFTRHSFPGMADAAPLYVSQAAQAAVATFTAEGFRAAAVTVLGVASGSALPEALHEIRWYEVTHDRPFGFLVVDRATDLVLFAGWVQEPTPLPEDSSLWW